MSRFSWASLKAVLGTKMTKSCDSWPLPSSILKITSRKPWPWKGQPWVHDTSHRHNGPIKSGTDSHPLQPLGHPQLFQKKNHERHKRKVLFLTLLLGVVSATQEEEAEQSLSEVPGMVLSGRRYWAVCVCVCVCMCVPFVVVLYGSMSQNISLQFYTCSISSLHHLLNLTLMNFSYSYNRERISQTDVGVLASDIRVQALSEMSQFLLFLWLHFF